MKPITLLSMCAGTLLVLLLPACTQPELGSPPKGYMSETTMKIAYATGGLKLIETEPEIPDNLAAYEDLLYKSTAEKDLKLDVYHANTLTETAPLLIFIHGGSWKKGNKDDYRRYLVDYANKGYVTATISYRFSQEATFPAALDDVSCALAWLRAHAAEYHINPDKIALIGGSAGGHLAMLLAYHGNDPDYVPGTGCEVDSIGKVQAIVNLYGPTDLTTEYARNNEVVINFIGTEFTEESREDYLAASPLNFITPDDPPTLTFHGTIDALVPVSQADTLDQLLKAQQVPSEYHRLTGWPHTMDVSVKVNEYCQYHMDAFFRKYLK